jgi:Fic family protein
LEEAPGVPFDDVLEVSGYVASLEHGMSRLRKDFPLSNRLSREMHAVLLSRGRGSDKSPGEFRRSQNWIGGTRPGNAHFVPPPPAQVEAPWLPWALIHDEHSLSHADQAALAHVQFETIHPFLDGWLHRPPLIAFILHHGRFQTAALSQPLIQHRSEYYRLLDLVRSEGDWEKWLDFFLEGVEDTASNAVRTAQRLVTLFKEDTVRVQSLGRAASSALHLFNALCERPITTLNDVCQRTGLSFPTATKGIDKLLNLAIMKERTGGRRNRVFSYERYLAILNEGTEPL